MELQRALERGHLKAGWVAGDDAFGMSPSFRESAMVSDAGAGGVAGVRRVSGVSASMYFLTVSLWGWIPNSLAIRRMDIP